MTQHDHREFMDWCFRCQLSRDELIDLADWTEDQNRAYDADEIALMDKYAAEQDAE